MDSKSEKKSNQIPTPKVPYGQIPTVLIISTMEDKLKILLCYFYTNALEYRYNVPECTRLLNCNKRSVQRLFKLLVDHGILISTSPQRVKFGTIPNYLFQPDKVLKYLKSLPDVELIELEPTERQGATTKVATDPTTDEIDDDDINQHSRANLNDKVATKVATDPTTKVATEVATEVATPETTNKNNKEYQETISKNETNKGKQEMKTINNQNLKSVQNHKEQIRLREIEIKREGEEMMKDPFWNPDINSVEPNNPIEPDMSAIEAIDNFWENVGK